MQLIAVTPYYQPHNTSEGMRYSARIRLVFRDIPPKRYTIPGMWNTVTKALMVANHVAELLKDNVSLPDVSAIATNPAYNE